MWAKLQGSTCLCKITRSYYQYGDTYYEFDILRVDQTFQHFPCVSAKLLNKITPTVEELQEWSLAVMQS